MTDPIRWLDAEDAPEVALAVLRESSDVPPMTGADRAAILDAIAASGLAVEPSAPPGSPAPPAAGGAVGAAGNASLPSVGIGLGVAAVGIGAALSIWWATQSPPRTITSPARDDVTVEAAPPPLARAPERSLVPTPTPTSVVPMTPLERPKAPATPAVTTSAHPAMPTRAQQAASSPVAALQDTLPAESALIGRARAAERGDPDAALASLEEHARRFPAGELAPERDFLIIRALERLGRTSEARRRASAYEAAHPSSPYGSAVQELLRELGP